ncbi:sensor histidine kinase [Alkalihalobacterium chitinilyticum]|uniref:histidine kinase n=1 Tax=Alkalihalobacterium chitinilyticum TaxID=2980103 RepID=A0ABT5VJE7_9BACI|nr:HAMP domain-containing sensor histidine kinase [Alkalihalobacterium chitinilyticum]MDE5415306.1 HAMP domain-containing histidine kinase [Alkalihalobacterium chitinilyticum]
MGIRNTLSVYFFKWILSIGFVGVCIILLNVGIVTWGLNNNVFLPANEPIKQAEKIKDIIENSDRIDPAIIPPQLDYAIFNKETNQIVHTNLSSRNMEKAQKAYINNQYGKSNSYLRYDSQNESLMIRYTLKIQFANLELRQAIPNPGVILLILTIIVFCTYLVYNIRRFSRLIIEENQKLIHVARKIKEKDLNIQFPEVTFNEYKDVMGAMENLSEALVKSIENEIESKRSKAEQISYLIHDIKIPLTVIKGNVELLEIDRNEESEETFSDIQNAIKQIESYIQEVIDINLNNKELKLNKEEITVNEFLEKVECEVKKLGVHNLIVENNSEKGTTLYIDIDLVIRALNNILLNAIERTPPHEKVQLIVRQDENSIQFNVIDGGPGFTEEALKRGTELFYTENVERTSNNHYGLGLTFTERVIKQHNGKLKLSNNANHSGDVQVKLPLRPAPH